MKGLMLMMALVLILISVVCNAQTTTVPKAAGTNAVQIIDVDVVYTEISPPMTFTVPRVAGTNSVSVAETYNKYTDKPNVPLPWTVNRGAAIDSWTSR